MKTDENLKRVLLTGANGFLGQIFRQEMSRDSIKSLDLGNADFNCDLSASAPELTGEFDMVIHCAGKAHVIPKTEEEKAAFFKINYDGTKNLCAGIDASGSYPKSFVLISSVSVYGLEYGDNIRESTSLNGDTAYALSKIKAEEFVKYWSTKNGVNYLILRLPLIVGDNPPGNLGSMISAIKRKRFFLINQGKARKSVVVANDLPNLVLQNKDKSGIFNLTDGRHPSFKELDRVLTARLNRRTSPSLPGRLVKVLSIFFGIFPFSPLNYEVFKKMTRDLTFNDDLARDKLNWHPANSLETLSKIKLNNE